MAHFDYRSPYKNGNDLCIFSIMIISTHIHKIKNHKKCLKIRYCCAVPAIFLRRKKTVFAQELVLASSVFVLGAEKAVSVGDYIFIDH